MLTFPHPRTLTHIYETKSDGFSMKTRILKILVLVYNAQIPQIAQIETALLSETTQFFSTAFIQINKIDFLIDSSHSNSVFNIICFYQS